MNVESSFHFTILFLPLIYLYLSPLFVPITIFMSYGTKRAWLQPACYTAIMLGLIIYEIILRSKKGFYYETIGYAFSRGRGLTICMLYFPFIAMVVAYTAYGRFVRKTADEEKQKQSALEENN